jgi:hypothetical protein
MKLKLNKFLTYLFAFISFSVFYNTGYAVNVTMNANAVVAAAALTAVETTPVDFGTIIISTVASEVTINASAGAATPSVTSGSASVSGGTSGVITVTSNLDANLTVTYPANATINDGTGPPANTMTMSQISTNSTASPFAATVAGPNLIHVGGVLSVANGQAAGNYTGTFTVTVNY